MPPPNAVATCTGPARRHGTHPHWPLHRPLRGRRKAGGQYGGVCPFPAPPRPPPRLHAPQPLLGGPKWFPEPGGRRWTAQAGAGAGQRRGRCLREQPAGSRSCRVYGHAHRAGISSAVHTTVQARSFARMHARARAQRQCSAAAALSPSAPGGGGLTLRKRGLSPVNDAPSGRLRSGDWPRTRPCMLATTKLPSARRLIEGERPRASRSRRSRPEG